MPKAFVHKKEQIITVNVDIFVCMNLRKLAISRGLKLMFLMLLPLCGIIHVLLKLYIFLRIIGKRE